MNLIRAKYFLFATLILTMILSAGCNISSRKAMPNGVDFNSLNVKQAKVIKTFETAKSNNKNVLLIFDAVWCGYCRKLNQITMKDAEVQKTLADFEIVNVDVDKYPEVLKAFENGSMSNDDKGVPLILIFSPEGVQIDEVNGYLEAKPFNKILKKNL